MMQMEGQEDETENLKNFNRLALNFQAIADLVENIFPTVRSTLRQ
jgi:hypothetical protein